MLNSSGIGRHARQVLSAIAGSGAEMTLLGNPILLADSAKQFDCQIVRMRSGIYNPLEQLELPLLIPRCDVFYSPHISTTRLPVKAARRVVTVHDVFHMTAIAGFNSLERAYARFLFDGALSTADVTMAVSSFTKSEIERYFKHTRKHIEVVSNCVDASLFYKILESPQTVSGDYILFVGNLKPHKNLQTAVKAMQFLEKKNLRLAVVGADSGFIHGMAPETLAALEVPEVVFLGKVNDKELQRLYSHALCLVFPSRYEGFGYPALEAMACGCPVVCSDIPPLQEVCGDAAIYCNPESAESFAKGIASLRSQSALRTRLSVLGIERARLFSAERFNTAVRKIFFESSGE